MGPVFICLGTNNIKRGTDGRKEAEKLIEQVRTFQHAKQKFIMELPPINRKGAEIERRIFNNTLHSNNEDKRFRVIRMIKEVVESPIELALQDDLHLTRENSKLTAAHIERVVEKYVTDKAQNQERERRTREEPTMETEKDRRQRNERFREEKRDIPCKFFQQDRCHRGSRCFFSHEIESSGSTRRGRSMERRQSDYDKDRRDSKRSRSKSGDRRRVIISDSRTIKPVVHE